MSIFNIFSRNRDRPATGRKTQISSASRKTISPYKSRTTNVLKQLRYLSDEGDAIEFLKGQSADISMAVWNFVRLANQGNQIAFYRPGTQTKMNDVEAQWREFASRINPISNSGLDGLLDQLHMSSFVLGAMGIEVEVSADRRDIVDIYPVKPNTITWEYEKRNERSLWIPYQQTGYERVSLEPGLSNFFWVPTDPNIDDPSGTKVLVPAIQAVDFQLQILQDLQAVLHHQGWPRDDYSINTEKLMASCPASIKNNPKTLQAWLQEQYDNVVNMLRKLEADSDIVHFDSITRNSSQGNANSRSLDVRAINELVDVQTLSGSKQLAIFMNRNHGVTESWGTVQFRIFCSGINSIQRGSKRLIEETARLWCRVKGIQAVPTFTHNTIDWSSEEQRMNVELMKEQYYAIAQLMGWIDENKAAQEVMKVEKAAGKPSESARVSFSGAGGKVDGRKNDVKGNGSKRSALEDQEDFD